MTAAPSGAVRVSTRRHQFTVGKPVDFDVESGDVSALEYALGALAAEIVGGLRVFAKRRRIELSDVEAVIVGQLDYAQTYLEVVGESGCPTLSRVSIKVFVASSHDEGSIRRLWMDTVERLPLVRTLETALDLTIELAITG